MACGAAPLCWGSPSSGYTKGSEGPELGLWMHWNGALDICLDMVTGLDMKDPYVHGWLRQASTRSDTHYGVLCLVMLQGR